MYINLLQVSIFLCSIVFHFSFFASRYCFAEIGIKLLPSEGPLSQSMLYGMMGGHSYDHIIRQYERSSMKFSVPPRSPESYLSYLNALSSMEDQNRAVKRSIRGSGVYLHL